MRAGARRLQGCARAVRRLGAAREVGPGEAARGLALGLVPASFGLQPVRRGAHEAAPPSSRGGRRRHLEEVGLDLEGKRARDLAAAHAQLEHVHGRLAALEAGAARRPEAAAGAAGAARGLRLAERLADLERGLLAAGQRHAKELEAVRGRQEELQDWLGEERADREEQQREVSALVASASEQQERLTQEVLERRERTAELGGNTAARDARCSAIEERLKRLERVHSDSVGRLTLELCAAHEKIEGLGGRLRAAEEACTVEVPPSAGR